MILHVCSVRDCASGLYGRPLFVAKTAQAVRSFTDEVNRPADDNELYKHPEDFELWTLALFDDNTGGFVPHERPELLVRAKDLARAVSEFSPVPVPLPAKGNGRAQEQVG